MYTTRSLTFLVEHRLIALNFRYKQQGYIYYFFFMLFLTVFTLGWIKNVRFYLTYYIELSLLGPMVHLSYG